MKISKLIHSRVYNVALLLATFLVVGLLFNDNINHYFSSAQDEEYTFNADKVLHGLLAYLPGDHPEDDYYIDDDDHPDDDYYDDGYDDHDDDDYYPSDGDHPDDGYYIDGVFYPYENQYIDDGDHPDDGYLPEDPETFINVPEPGAWVDRENMPTDRYWLHAEGIDGLLYVVGGTRGGSGVTGALEVYDPSRNIWTTKEPMSNPEYGGATAVIGTKLYLAGGWNWPISGIPQSSLQIYDSLTDTWTQGVRMPTLSGCSMAGVIDEKMYVLTPCNGYSGYRDFFHVYDPASPGWTELARVPNIHADGAAEVIDGKLYVVGGLDGVNPSNRLDAYDPVTNTWENLLSMPTARYGPGSGVLNGKLYVMGGSNADGEVMNSVDVYDPVDSIWRSAPNMRVARGFLAGEGIGDQLYAVGGQYGGSNSLTNLEVYTEGTVTVGGGGSRIGECGDYYSPVCATNGITYSNSCWAHEDNVEIVYNGECEEDDHDDPIFDDLDPEAQRRIELALRRFEAKMNNLVSSIEEAERQGYDISSLERLFANLERFFDETPEPSDEEAFWEAMELVNDMLDEIRLELNRLLSSEHTGFPEEGESTSRSDLDGQQVYCYFQINDTGELIECGDVGCLLPDGGYCVQSGCYSPDGRPTEIYYDLDVDEETCRDANGTDVNDLLEPPPAGYEEEVVTAFKENPFPDTDVESLEGRAAADLYRRAVIGGFPDGEFKGDRPVNRAEAAKFLLLAAGIDVRELQNNGRFWDVLEGEWYVPFVITAAEEGIINGHPDGSFRPGDTVNTAEFLKMLSIAFGLAEDLPHSYTDVASKSI